MTIDSGRSTFEFQVLGPLLVRRDGVPVPISAAMLRRLLATLLCRAGRPVAVDTLMAVLWGGRPPRSAHKTLQVYVRRLRSALGAGDRIRYGPAGYTAAVTGAELDALRFERLTADARSAGGRADLASAAESLERALGLWRGTAYDDVSEYPVVADEARRLEELRLLAHEDLAAVQLVRGLHAGLIAGLTELAARHPYRERLHACLMLALSQAGRQVEALEVYRRARETLQEELGLEPGRTLRLVHETVLRGDVAAPVALELLGPAYRSGGPVGGGSRRARRDAPSDGAAPTAGAVTGSAGRAEDPRREPGPAGRCGPVLDARCGLVLDAPAGPAGRDAAGGAIAACPARPADDRAAAPGPPGGLASPASAPWPGPSRSGPGSCIAAGPGTVVPFQLPPDTPDFTGRREQVDALRWRLIEAREFPVVPIVALDGGPGVGKTALAVRVAHGLREIFHDGQLFIDLRGTDPRPLAPAAALAKLLASLGVSGPALPGPLDERGRLLRALLARRRTLVVLDNAASEEQVRHLLPGFPGAAVLVTSRRRLAGLPAHFVHLGPLDPVAAGTLLLRVGGWRRVAAEPAAAAEIVRLCDRLPLAIRIAGAKLALREHWSLARLAARLREERRRLDELTVGDLSVRDGLAASYALLDPAARRALRLLALLDTPEVTAADLAALLGVPPAEAEGYADLLVDARMLDCVGADAGGLLRYRLPGLVRLYARERADAEECPLRRHEAVSRALAARRLTSAAG